VCNRYKKFKQNIKIVSPIFENVYWKMTAFYDKKEGLTPVECPDTFDRGWCCWSDINDGTFNLKLKPQHKKLRPNPEVPRVTLALFNMESDKLPS
jgi:hypothetical protein